MLADFKVGRCSRKCYVEDRPLKPGETFYSVVIETNDGELERRDYSAGVWTEPPDGTLGWWKGRIPITGKQKLVLAPNPVLVDLLRQLSEHDQREELAYLLALLLMRRRVVRPLETMPPLETSLDAPAEATPQPVESELPHGTDEVDRPRKCLTVEVIADGQTIEVTECEIQAKDASRLSDELHELLYCEAE